MSMIFRFMGMFHLKELDENIKKIKKIVMIKLLSVGTSSEIHETQDVRTEDVNRLSKPLLLYNVQRWDR